MEIKHMILILIGLAAGLLSGMVGIGGGILIVPALVYFLGFSQISAQGTSLAVLLLPIGILGVLNYYKSNQINLSATLLISLGFVAGSYFGSKLTIEYMPPAMVKKFFAGLLVLVGLRMLWK